MISSALPTGLRLPHAPLRELGLRLFPARPGPCRILELDAQERLAAPPSLPQHLRRQQHKARVGGQGHCGHGGGWRPPAARAGRVLPQQPAGLILVLLGDHVPAAIPQQRHKQPTRRLAHPPRMHRGGHDVEPFGLPAPQPAPGVGLLV